MKKSRAVKAYFADDMAKKLAFVAKNEGMSVSNLLVFLARQKIAYYEKVKGNIKDKDVLSVSLDEFETLE